MGTLMYIMWMRKGKRRPSEFARILKDKIIENEGGTKGPRDNRESAKAVWERALSFWSIPKCDWYSDDINHLRMFAAWSLRSLETAYESLRPFVALVNYCRGIGEPYLPKGTAPDNTRCWAYNQNVIRIRNAYAAVVESNARERRNAVIPAITRSAGNCLPVNTSEGRKKKVLCAISEAVAMRMLKNGEKNFETSPGGLQIVRALQKCLQFVRRSLCGLGLSAAICTTCMQHVASHGSYVARPSAHAH